MHVCVDRGIIGNKITMWTGIRNTGKALTSSQVGAMSIMGKTRHVNATSRAKTSSKSANR